MARLSRDLTLRLGKGFSRSNLQNMRAFYLRFPIRQKVSGKLTWSHYVELIGISDEMNSQMFVSKYQLYLPNKDELRRLLDENLSASAEEGDGE